MVKQNIKPKPVKASEIKDVKIAKEAIAEVKRTPTPRDLAYMEETRKLFQKVIGR